jgi:lipoate-protein ligase A
MAMVRVLTHSPRNRYLNMAVDEALLRHCRGPVLRFYRWAEPDAVSIGYFQARADAPAGRPFVRRYTGGGLVDHAGDFTYSVILPRTHPLAGAGTSECYRRIHEALALALRHAGVPARLAAADDAVASRACFQKAVRYDVVTAAARGAKLAGAAQRRARAGCLHQGSVRAGAFDFDALCHAIGGQLIGVLGSDGEAGTLSAEEEASARRLEVERYATAAWNLAR